MVFEESCGPGGGRNKDSIIDGSTCAHNKLFSNGPLMQRKKKWRLIYWFRREKWTEIKWNLHRYTHWNSNQLGSNRKIINTKNDMPLLFRDLFLSSTINLTRLHSRIFFFFFLPSFLLTDLSLSLSALLVLGT